MKHSFHTEDCGVSLICRCCRGPICEQRLSKADRMRIQREWAEYPRIRQPCEPRHSSGGILARLVGNLFSRIGIPEPANS